MRLTRRGRRTNTNHKPRELANIEFPEISMIFDSRTRLERSFDGKNFTVLMSGVDGWKNSPSQYEYEITLSLKEIRSLLSWPFDSLPKEFPGGREISDAEKKLWNTLFDQWEKRIRALGRKRK